MCWRWRAGTPLSRWWAWAASQTSSSAVRRATRHPRRRTPSHRPASHRLASHCPASHGRLTLPRQALPAGLAELLERCAPSLDHVGIGGCAALPGDEAFSLLAERLPGLTALSAHKLGGLHGKGVELLFKSCPRLRSLDVADCADLSFRPRGARTCRPLYLEEEVDIPTGQAWTALGTLRVGEHFVLGQVITAVGPVMSGRMPDDHPEDEDGYYDDESDSDDLGGGQGVLGADESSGSDDGDEEGAGVG